MSELDDKDFAIRAPYMQKIIELQQENAELKAKLGAWERQYPIGYVYESDDYDKSIIRTDPKSYKKAIPLFSKPKDA